MEIHFISSLTVDDEARVATALLNVAGCLLDQFAIAYSVRIETADGVIFQRTHPPVPTGVGAQPVRTVDPATSTRES
jgi:hypothetical protein